MIIIIDNYDSFSYNLFQMMGNINSKIRVIRNDSFSCEEIEVMKPSKIVISPGPGRPGDAGICEKAIRYFKGKVPILGVCLGHQAICEVFGANIIYAKELMHGKQSMVAVNNKCTLFKGLPPEIKVGRYHSLSADEHNFPEGLEVVGRTADQEIMAVKHRDYEIYGLQFHPESILTPLGADIIKNFLLN